MTLHHRDGGDLPVAWYACHRHTDHDMPLMCGVDPHFSGREDSAYRQMLTTIVLRGLERGVSTIHLGMDAAAEKRRLGAEMARRVAWTLVRGDHHAAELETIIAELATVSPDDVPQVERGAAK